jgi:hypothetical protein
VEKTHPFRIGGTGLNSRTHPVGMAGALTGR